MEQSARQNLLNSFLLASHGQTDEIGQRHSEALVTDPLFYSHLSRWYQRHGSIRDHHELFCAHLLCAPQDDFREHALVMAQTLRPYQLSRVVRYTKEKLHYPTRVLKAAVQHYLRRREATPEWFDECVIRDRHSMKHLYTTLHLKPGQRAQDVLFGDEPPSDSRVKVARELHSLKNHPVQQADLIRRYHIHLTTAMGAVRYYTPEILAALVEVMTPQQLINHLSFLEKRGGLASPVTRPMVLRKLRDGATESRVQDFKTGVALKKIQGDSELTSTLLEMTETRIQSRGRICVPTALLVDKSGSMTVCIQMGIQLATMASVIADAPFFVEAFDAHSFTVRSSTPTLEGWQRAFRDIHAAGATSIGVSMRKLRDHALDQIVLISDGEENTAPLFRDEILDYQRRHNKRLKVIYLKVSRGVDTLQQSMSGTGVDMQTIQFSGDYYNLPNVIPFLTQGAGFEMVEEVLRCPLYTREDLAHLPPGFDPVSYEIL